jgi:hypothetical protein
LRLLVDEHYPRAIAERLRERGHDVVSAVERDDLAATEDALVLDRMQAERRAVLTNNHRDWRPLCAQAILAGEHHYGLLLTSDRSLSRTTQNIGRFVELLDAFLSSRRAEDACLDEEHWLS